MGDELLKEPRSGQAINKSKKFLIIGIGTSIVLGALGTLEVLGLLAIFNSLKQVVMIIISLIHVFLFIKIFQEKQAEHLAEVEKNTEAHASMVEDIQNIGALLDENSRKVQDIVTQVTESYTAVNLAAAQIAEGAIDNDASIQIQLEMTTNINSYIKATSDEFEKVKTAVGESEEYLHAGKNIINELSLKAAQTDQISRDTHEAMIELKDKSAQIHNITGLMQSISEQTNLLALNAAIESARVGEAGRGFAIVAEEVRKLASQSKTFATNIAGIINDLQEKASYAVDAIAKLNDVSTQQNRLIIETKEAFEKITQRIIDLYRHVNGVNERMEQIVSSNNNIVESINNISAVSEETTASSQEVVSMANEGLEYSKETIDHVNELLELLELFKYIGEQ